MLIAIGREMCTRLSRHVQTCVQARVQPCVHVYSCVFMLCHLPNWLLLRCTWPCLCIDMPVYMCVDMGVYMGAHVCAEMCADASLLGYGLIIVGLWRYRCWAIELSLSGGRRHCCWAIELSLWGYRGIVVGLCVHGCWTCRFTIVGLWGHCWF